MAKDAFRNPLPGQPKPLTGAAQRSGAKSGAKRFDTLPTKTLQQEIKSRQNLHSKSSPLSYPNQPLKSPNIQNNKSSIFLHSMSNFALSAALYTSARSL
jgi:hypothetical protein